MLKAANGTDTVYYTRGFELISRHEGENASYYLFDGGLSVRALTDEAGDVTDTLVFDAFGNETEKTGITDNAYRFQGEEKDATGLYYLRARYMDPVTGTFTSMDTYAGSLSDPMSLHKYLFANSNPVMYSDPSGHETTLIECVEVCAIVGLLAGESLYLIHCFVNDEQVTAEGVLLSSVIGAVVAIAIFFAVYLIAKFIVFIIAVFSAKPDEAEKLTDSFTKWLNKGDFNNKVYFATENGKKVYTGITKQSLDARLYQHLYNEKPFDKSGLIKVYEALTRNQARAIEQYYIINGPHKYNSINSISPLYKYYEQAYEWAENYIRTHPQSR